MRKASRGGDLECCFAATVTTISPRLSGQGKVLCGECTFVGDCSECGDSVRVTCIEAIHSNCFLCYGCVERCPSGWWASLQWVRSHFPPWNPAYQGGESFHPPGAAGHNGCIQVVKWEAQDCGYLERAEEEEAAAKAKALCILAAASLSEALECAKDKVKEAAVAEQGRRFLADASLAKAARQERAATPTQQGGGGNKLEAPDLSVLKELLASAKLKSPSLKAALHAWMLDREGAGDAVGSKRARG